MIRFRFRLWSKNLAIVRKSFVNDDTDRLILAIIISAYHYALNNYTLEHELKQEILFLEWIILVDFMPMKA